MLQADRLLETFLTLVQIDSPSGKEEEIGAYLEQALADLGLRVERDPAGNVMGWLEGKGEPILLNAHMDTVQPGEGVKPVVENGIIRSDGTTILGADDKSGIALILEVLAGLKDRPDRPAVEVLFTVAEEIGLIGARAADLSRFEAKEMLVFDTGGPPNTIVGMAPWHDVMRVTVKGRAAHSGVCPEEGINAIQVAAKAIARMQLGRIDEETTANVGTIEGGKAVNIVPDEVQFLGEVRSHDVEKLRAHMDAIRQAVESAVGEYPGAEFEWEMQRMYEGYRFDEDHPLVKKVCEAMRRCGVEPVLKRTGGGSDANIFNAKGVSAVVVSTGMQASHTLEEWIALDDLMTATRVVWSLLTGEVL